MRESARGAAVVPAPKALGLPEPLRGRMSSPLLVPRPGAASLVRSAATSNFDLQIVSPVLRSVPPCHGRRVETPTKHIMVAVRSLLVAALLALPRLALGSLADIPKCGVSFARVMAVESESRTAGRLLTPSPRRRSTASSGPSTRRPANWGTRRASATMRPSTPKSRPACSPTVGRGTRWVGDTGASSTGRIGRAG